MDFLRPIFEDQLEIKLDEDDISLIEIGSTPYTATQILRQDDDAYQSEFNAWLNDQWLPDQLDRLDSLRKLHANEKRYEDLCEVLGNNELVPFVGSGMSVPSGLQTWSHFLRGIRHHSSLSEADLEVLLSTGRFEDAVEALASSMPDRLFDERIEHDLRVSGGTAISGAVLLLPVLFDRLVITTNLDNLLEQLYENSDMVFPNVLAGKSVADYRRLSQSTPRLLLKLHGDSCSAAGRVLGKTEYEEAYKTGEALQRTISSIYSNRSLLCLGCSMGNDRTIDLLAEVAKADPDIPKHYAFLSYPDDENELREREHFLTERDVFPIWYEGDHDEAITTLLVGMAHHLRKF